MEAALRFNSGWRLVNYVERGGMRESEEQLEVLVVPQISGMSGGASFLREFAWKCANAVSEREIYGLWNWLLKGGSPTAYRFFGKSNSAIPL